MTILGIITIITGITFLLNAYVFYVRFMQRKENCSKQIVVLVINYKRKTYRSFDNPTPTYFFFPLYQFKTRKREYKIQSKLGRRIKPEKGEYIEIFVNPKNPTELYEPADNFFLRRLCKQRVGHNQKSGDWRHITDAYRLDIDMFYPLKEERKDGRKTK